MDRRQQTRNNRQEVPQVGRIRNEAEDDGESVKSCCTLISRKSDQSKGTVAGV